MAILTRRDDAAWTAALADPAGCRVEVLTMQLIRRQVRTKRGATQRDEHVLNLVVEGEGELTLPGPPRRLRPGVLFWLAPGTPFSFSAERGRNLAWLNCRFRLFREGTALSFAAPLRFHPEAADCRRWFELWLGDRRSQHPEAARRFALGLALLWGDLRRPPARGGLGESRRKLLLAHLRTPAGLRSASSRLARLVGLGPTHFRRAFRATFGVSPRTFILRERLARAADRLRLEPDRRIADLAGELGWFDPALFSRQFRAAYGQPPDRWRRT